MPDASTVPLQPGARYRAAITLSVLGELAAGAQLTGLRSELAQFGWTAIEVGRPDNAPAGYVNPGDFALNTMGLGFSGL